MSGFGRIVDTLAGLTGDVTLTSVARGDVLVRGASKWANVAVGTEDQVLTVTDIGGGVLEPRWATAAAGGLDGSGTATHVPYFSDTDTLTSDAGLTYGSRALTVNTSASSDSMGLFAQCVGTARIKLLPQDAGGAVRAVFTPNNAQAAFFECSSASNADFILSNGDKGIQFRNGASNTMGKMYLNSAAYELLWHGRAVISSSGKDLVIDQATRGLVLKDTQGTPHYWRVTVDNSGTLVTADLGTSYLV
jgi:hypothetical protein